MPVPDNTIKNMSEKPPTPVPSTCSLVPIWIDPRNIPRKTRIAGNKLCKKFGI